MRFILSLILFTMTVSGAVAQSTNSNDDLENVAAAAILASNASQTRETARAAVAEAAAAVEAATAKIVAASDWLQEYGDSGAWSEENKQTQRDVVVEETVILIAAQRQLAAAEDNLSAAEANWDQRLADFKSAKTTVQENHADEIAALRTNLKDWATTTRQLALVVLHVCNDQAVEADPQICDPYEGKAYSHEVISTAHSFATND